MGQTLNFIIPEGDTLELYNAIYFQHNTSAQQAVAVVNPDIMTVPINNLWKHAQGAFMFGPGTYCRIENSYLYVANFYLDGKEQTARPIDWFSSRDAHFSQTSVVSYKFDIMPAIRHYERHREQLIKDNILCDGKFHN